MSKKPRQNNPRKPVVATSNPDGAAGDKATPVPASVPKPGPRPTPPLSGAAKPRPVASAASPLAETGAVAQGPAAQTPSSTPKQDPAHGGSGMDPGQSSPAPDPNDIKAAVVPEPKAEEKDAQLPSDEPNPDSTKQPEKEIPEASPEPPAPRAENTATDSADVVVEPDGGSVPESSDGPVQQPAETDPVGKVEELLPEALVATPAQPGDESELPAAGDPIIESETQTVPESADAPELLQEETDQRHSVDEVAPEGLADTVAGPAKATPSPDAGGVVPETVPTPRPSAGAYKALAFVLEVALLGAVGLWAIGALPFAPVLSIAIVAIPLIVFWAVFMSPQAALRFRWPVQPIVAHLLFAAGTGLLFIAQQPVMGAAMGFLTLVSIVLTLVQRRTLLESGTIAPRPPKPAGRRAAR